MRVRRHVRGRSTTRDDKCFYQGSLEATGQYRGFGSDVGNYPAPCNSKPDHSIQHVRVRATAVGDHGRRRPSLVMKPPRVNTSCRAGGLCATKTPQVHCAGCVAPLRQARFIVLSATFWVSCSSPGQLRRTHRREHYLYFLQRKGNSLSVRLRHQATAER